MAAGQRRFGFLFALAVAGGLKNELLAPLPAKLDVGLGALLARRSGPESSCRVLSWATLG
jgi:hypothetical protein